MREESHELGRSYALGVMDYFKSIRYLNGASQYSEVANAYDSPHFCEIVLDDGNKISFDILLKRFVGSHRYKFCYVECKYVGSIRTASRVEKHHQEFLEKVYMCIEPAAECHRGNVDFIFASNAPVRTFSRMEPNVETLSKLLQKPEVDVISMKRVGMMCNCVKCIHIPLWILEPYREEVAL